MKKEEEGKEYYFLKSIESYGDGEFFIRVFSLKGGELSFILIKELVKMENGEFVSLYRCDRDEDNRILSRDIYDVRGLMRAVTAFDSVSHP
jgi:hypothetical protein